MIIVIAGGRPRQLPALRRLCGDVLARVAERRARTPGRGVLLSLLLLLLLGLVISPPNNKPPPL